MSSIGSIWQKWDLHIHTPASFEWHGQGFSEMDEEANTECLARMIAKIEESDVKVFAVMDYWTFDGYFRLLEHIEGLPNKPQKLILPGIEFRMEAPTDFRLNTHVIFDNGVSKSDLDGFLSNLRIVHTPELPVSEENFVRLAKGFDSGKLRTHGFNESDRDDDARMLELGLKTAVITRDSVDEALRPFCDEQYLKIQPYDTSDGLEDLDWQEHPCSDSILMKWADVFETRNPKNIGLFLGDGIPEKPNVGEEFLHNLGGKPKPVVSGSDAHQVSDYGNFPNGRATWIKAHPSFAGLRQTCNEPKARCFIGHEPPKVIHARTNSTKYIKKVSIAKSNPNFDEKWFDGVSIDLNPGLVAIIGNKGSGKSALADIIALCGNAQCNQMEFLNKNRFRQGNNRSKDFTASITWQDDSTRDVTLDTNPDPNMPERIRYLPQQAIETLCNEIGNEGSPAFEMELKKVIFSHVPNEDRLDCATLDELIEYKLETIQKSIVQVLQSVSEINQKIVHAENESSEEALKKYKTELSLAQQKLDAHEKTKPNEIPKPADNNNPDTTEDSTRLLQAQSKLKELHERRERLLADRKGLVSKLASLERAEGHIKNFESAIAEHKEDAENDLGAIDLAWDDIVTIKIDVRPFERLRSSINDALNNISDEMNGKPGQVGLEDSITQEEELIEGLKSKLNAPQKEYQDYLSALKTWGDSKVGIIGDALTPDSLEFFKARVKAAEDTLPKQILELKGDRADLVRKLHGEKIKIRDVYRSLYGPVQSIAEATEFTQEAIDLEFHAYLTSDSFVDSFLDFIHQNRKGNFYGAVEGRELVKQQVEEFDFSSVDSLLQFQDKIVKLLTEPVDDVNDEKLSIDSQLRDHKSRVELYDFIFGIEYLEPRYSLRLGGKDITQLSPGEKGALLLVFYLLLDKEDIPIVIDQPEQNLDNESVVKLLVDCIRRSRDRRQVIIVTHNPNLAIVCDADQLIRSNIEKNEGNKISYTSGAIEESELNQAAVDVLEGTYRAFNNRRMKYQQPV